MRTDFDGAYKVWTYLHSTALLLLTVAVTPLFTLSEGLLFWFLAPYTVFILLRLYHIGGWGQRSLADLLTASRGIGAALLFLWAALIPYYPDLTGPGWRWSLVAFLAAVEATDFFDGRVARRRGSRRFGAVWDMENDALFIFALTLVGWIYLGFPVWALLIGLMRYAYFLIFRTTGDPPGYPAAYKWFAKSVAALIALSLLVAYLPELGETATRLLLAPVLSLQLISFGWDLLLQIRAGRVSLLETGIAGKVETGR